MIDSYPAREAWDASATELVRTMLDRWHLKPGAAFVGGEAGATLMVTTSDGAPAVLKVGFPHFEAVHEAVALEAWSPGKLAPVVLRQDPWTWSMLLEEVRPGTPLSSHPDTNALDAAAKLLARLHSTTPPDGLPRLSDTVVTYIAEARSRQADQAPALAALGASTLYELALDVGEQLAEDSVGSALLHGDFNPGNVLKSADGQWVTIDPKPMIGDPAFDLFPLSEQLGDVRDAPERLATAATAISCDPSRAARWALVRSALNVSWYLADGDLDASSAASVEADMWREVSGL